MTTTSFNIYQQLTSVRLTTTVNLAGDYFNGQLNNGVGATLTAETVGHLIVDGVSTEVGDRLLVIHQDSPSQNGIYVVQTTGGPISLWMIERAPDFQSLEQLKVGQYVTVGAGDTLDGSIYVLVEPLPSSIGSGSTGFTFIDVSSSGGGPFFAVANNLSEADGTPTLVANIGLGEQSGRVTLVDADFAAGGGTYILTNPPPTIIYLQTIGAGRTLQLPPQNEADSLQASQSIEIQTSVDSEPVQINNAAGAPIFLINPDSAWFFIPNNKSSLAGSWLFQGEVLTVQAGNVGAAELTGNLLLESSDGSVNITNTFNSIDFSVVDSAGSPIAQLIWINDADGDDANNGTINSPLKTYEAARLIAAASATENLPYIIKPIGVFNITGDMLLSPFVNIVGEEDSASQFIITGQLLLDSAFDTAVNSFCRLSNVDMSAAGNVDLVFNVSNNSSVHFDNVDFSGTPAIDFTGSDGGSPETIIIEKGITLNSTPTITAENLVLAVVNSNFQGDITAINSSSTTDTLMFLQANVGLGGNVIIRTTGSNSLTAAISASPFTLGGLTIDGTNSSIFIDSSSYASIPTFLNGATISQVNILSITDGVNQTSYSPINYTPIGTTNYSSTSLTANLAGIDAALSSVAGSAIAQQLWVNDADGNDSNTGDIDHPLKTYEAARLISVASASPTNRYLINIIGDQSITGDMTLSPYVDIAHQAGLLVASGNIVLDGSWSSLSNEKIFVDKLTTTTSIDLVYTAGVHNYVYFRDCNFSGASSFTVGGPVGASAATCGAIIERNVDFGGTTFTGDVTASSADLLLQDATISGDVNGLIVGDDANPVVILNSCQVSGSLNLTWPGFSGSLSCIVRNTTVAVNISGSSNISLNIDSASYVGNIGLSGGATIGLVTLASLSDGVEVSPSSFVPINYTPFAPLSNISIESVTSHLAGIDNAITSIVEAKPSFGEMYFTGNSTATTITVQNTFYPVNATYSAGLLQNYTQTADELKYSGPTTTALVVCELTASYSGASNNTTFALYQNGSIVSKSQQQVFIGGITPAPETVVVGALLTLNNNDTIQVYVANNDSTDDITVGYLNCKAVSGAGPASGTGIQIEQQLWVNDAVGSDSANTGDIDSPFQTYDHARSVAVALGASEATPFVIKTIGVQNITGDMEIEPFVYVEGGVYNTTGDVVLSANWSSGISSSKINNCQFNPNGALTFTFGGFASSLYLSNVIMGGANPGIVIFTGTGKEYLEVNNFTTDPTDISSYQLTVTSIFRADLRDLDNISTLNITATSSATNDCTTYLYNTSAATTTMSAAPASSQDQTLYAYASPLGNLTVGPVVLGTNASILNITNDCLTAGSSVTTQNGGVINLIGSAGSVNADFTPSSYTPASGNLSDSVKNHLQGIDAALPVNGQFTFTYNAVLSTNITGTPTKVFGTYTKQGDYITANLTLSFKPSAVTCFIAFDAPFVAPAAFPIDIVVSMTGTVYKDTGTAIGDGQIGLGGNQPGNLSGTNSIIVPIGVVAANVFYYVNMSFSYQFQNF